MSDNTTPEAVDEVAKALKQVLMVSPQLLFEASKKVGADIMLDGLRNEIKGASKEKLMRDHIRSAICMSISRLLIQSGLADLTDEDVANMAMALRSMNRVEP